MIAASSGGSRSLVIGGVAAVVVFLALLLAFRVAWWAGLAVASMVFVFIDATLARVTRLTPSSGSSGMTPTLWALICIFFPVLPLYFVLRTKLVAASLEDIGDPSKPAEELEDEGKVRPPSLVSPGTVVVVAVAVLAAVYLSMAPSVRMEFGRPINRTNPNAHLARWDTTGKAKYDQGVSFAVRVVSSRSIENADKVVCKVFQLMDDGETEVDHPVEVEVEEGRRAFWLLTLKEAGSYRVDVTAPDGRSIISRKVGVMRTM